jgi:hypothetical protein
MDSNEAALKLAQHHVAECEAWLTRQRAIIAELARQGRDTAQAQALLDTINYPARCSYEPCAAPALRRATRGGCLILHGAAASAPRGERKTTAAGSGAG